MPTLRRFTMTRSGSLAACVFLLLGLASGAWARSDGEKALAEFEEKGSVYSGALADYVAQVGQRMVRAAGQDPERYTFTVLDDPSINAFAVDGGYIFVARGLLAYLENEPQLAAVLGHEIGHLVARHPQERKLASRSSRIGSTILGFLTRSGALYQTARAYSEAALSGYGRDQELEADGLGARYLADAGYDPIAMLEVIRVLADQEEFAREVEGRSVSYHGLFASHPRNDRRLFEVIQAGAAEGVPPERSPSEGPFLSLLEGLPWGAPASDGVLVDRRYYHSGLGFVVDFPESWRVKDSPSALSATAPHGAASLITLELREESDKEDASPTPEAMVVEVMETEIEGGRPFTVDELPAYLAVVKHEGEARRLIAVVQKGNRYFVFKGENTHEGFDDAFLRAFSATVLSFRRMRQADLAEATTTRVQLHLATPEDSYESLAAALRLGPRGADRLRLLNGDYPRGQPRAGDRLKVIR